LPDVRLSQLAQAAQSRTVPDCRHPVPGSRSCIVSPMSDHLTRFREFRERMNGRIMEAGPLETKRVFALDTRANATLDDIALERIPEA
jgi:hypothetical protein